MWLLFPVTIAQPCFDIYVKYVKCIKHGRQKLSSFVMYKGPDEHFLPQRITLSDILARDRYLIHIILPRLSCVDCTLVVLVLMYMVVK